jgi:aryl-alcohol dehydrogenase-like predicted oxidoreductase
LTGKYSGAQSGEGRLRENFLGLGNYFLTERNLKIVGALEEFCRARGHTLLELAVSWIAAQPAVSSVICGATRVEQVEQNVKAAGWSLTAEELAEVDKLTKAA